MSEPRSQPRINVIANEPGYNQTSIESGEVHTDGYRVTVGWDGECWEARLTGLDPRLIITDHLGHGYTKVAALLDLACSLATTIDMLTGERMALPSQEGSAP